MDHLARRQWRAAHDDWRTWPRNRPGGPPKPGRAPCRGCGGELTGRRTSWCSTKCERFRALRTNEFRKTVWAWSDKRCACCGLDLQRVVRLVRKALYGARSYYRHIHYGSKANRLRRLFRVLGWPEPKDAWSQKHVWEADHIIPKYDGGDHGPANGWVLCLGCHREKCAREAKHRSRLRKAGLLYVSYGARARRAQKERYEKWRAEWKARKE